nr:MAG TPA: hypothetical protein [Caudoviricetes sp.]
MAIELVTGYQGKDHVTADQWADFNRGIFGKDTILPIGNRMETAIQTANQITVKDGVAVIDGRQVYIGYGESENIVIESGTQGMLRRDIVVLEYNKDESGVESVAFKVITGEPKASDAVDPSVENTDIRTGVSTSQKPFCRVRLNGTAIEGVDALIPVREFKSHVFEDTVKDFTATETGHIPDATLAKKLKDEVNELNGKTENINNLIYSTGYIAQPYQIKVPTGESLFLITSDSALWHIISMSASIYVKQLTGDSTYLITSDVSSRTITVKGQSSGDIAVSYVRFKPRYK